MSAKAKTILKSVTYVWILLGIMAISGSLMSKNITENEPGNLFDPPIYSLIFFLLPLIFLKISLKMNVKTWVIITATLASFFMSGMSQLGQTYNYFIQASEDIDKSLDNIAIVYEKKLAILPAIKSSSLEYNEYEAGIINRIVEGRMKISNADNSSDKIGALKQLASLSKEISINIENYPNLKSIETFKDFIRTTKEIEEEVRNIKTSYNEKIATYNRNCKVFPYVFIANSMGMEERKYFSKLH